MIVQIWIEIRKYITFYMFAFRCANFLDHIIHDWISIRTYSWSHFSVRLIGFLSLLLIKYNLAHDCTYLHLDAQYITLYIFAFLDARIFLITLYMMEFRFAYIFDLISQFSWWDFFPFCSLNITWLMIVHIRI